MRNKWLLALTAIGVLLLALGAGGIGQPQPPRRTGGAGSAGALAAAQPAGTLQTVEQYELYYDRQLTRIIDQIAGISDALVMVTVNSTASLQLGENVTTSRQTSSQAGGGGSTSTTTSTESQVVTVQGASGNTSPVVVEQQLPHIAGVLVVARASDPIRMEAEITLAVEDALGIPGYEITVLPRK